MYKIVIIPAYNEGFKINEVVKDCSRYSDAVVVCDDGSADNTYTEAKKAGAYVIRHSLNSGKGAATVSAMKYALKVFYNKDCIFFTIDGDGQNSSEEITLLYNEMLNKKADVVNGSRFLSKNKIPLIRKIYNKIGNIISFLFTGVSISDSQTGFRAYNKKILDIIIANVNIVGYGYDSEVLRVIKPYKPKIVEVPITVKYTDYSMNKGTHGQNLLTGIKMVGTMIMRSLLGK